MPEPWTPVVVARPGERSSRDAEFTAFMAEAEPVLGRTAYLLTGNRHRAEELVQQALVRTYVAWPRARSRDPLAYARRVLANARIDTWRKHRREVLLAPDDLPHGRHGGADGGHAERDLLVRALARLPEQRRRVVVLRYLVDLGEREVAEDLGISVGAVKSAASRGLAQLRGVLDANAGTTAETEGAR
ncbi:SigE family RNA polymerase sigma factor [Isoptericola sp. AK164]|uniref:SigE family RNA polymerase sigma factor n=1 Tax=Isoptericola sp. AK164 TaxID=3024246 RepID=UPI00241856DE|nr:SigE family RNA polymerase sigma factor [Isoptericola sp. AK164]